MMYLGKDAVGLATSLPIFSDIIQLECGTFTLTEDTLIPDQIINHNLGVIPDFFTLYAAESVDYESTSRIYVIESSYLTWPSQTAEDYYAYSIFGLPLQMSGGGFLKTNAATESSFHLLQPNSKIYYFKANVKYYYMIGKFKEVTSNA